MDFSGWRRRLLCAKKTLVKCFLHNAGPLERKESPPQRGPGHKTGTLKSSKCFLSQLFSILIVSRGNFFFFLGGGGATQRYWETFSHTTIKSKRVSQPKCRKVGCIDFNTANRRAMSASINTQGMFYIWFGLKWTKWKKRSQPTAQSRFPFQWYFNLYEFGFCRKLWFCQWPPFPRNSGILSISSIKCATCVSSEWSDFVQSHVVWWPFWTAALRLIVASVPRGVWFLSARQSSNEASVCVRVVVVVRHQADLVGRSLVNRAFRQFGPRYFPSGFQQKWGDCFSSGGWKPFPKNVYVFLKNCWGKSVGGRRSLGNLKKFRAFRL